MMLDPAQFIKHVTKLPMSKGIAQKSVDHRVGLNISRRYRRFAKFGKRFPKFWRNINTKS